MTDKISKPGPQLKCLFAPLKDGLNDTQKLKVPVDIALKRADKLILDSSDSCDDMSLVSTGIGVLQQS